MLLPKQPPAAVKGVKKVKYNKKEARKKLVAAIACQYEEKRMADAEKPRAQSTFFNICEAADSTIEMKVYLRRFQRLEKISVTAFLHMTMLIDTWFCCHPNDRFGPENSYGLIVSALYLAHGFHDGEFICSESRHKKIHLDTELAVCAGISFKTLRIWIKNFTKGIDNHFRYTHEEYEAAEARFLLSENRDPTFFQLASELAEFKPLVIEKTAEATVKDLLVDSKKNINEEKSVKEILIPRLAARIESALKVTEKKPRVLSPFDLGPVLTMPVAEYLNLFLNQQLSSITVSTWIYFAMILDAWIANNRQGVIDKSGFLVLSETDSCCVLNAYNARLIIPLSLLTARDDDYRSGDDFKRIAYVAGYDTRELKRLQENFLTSMKGSLFYQPLATTQFLSPEDSFRIVKDKKKKVTQIVYDENPYLYKLPGHHTLYEQYHNELLPEYHLDLTPRQQPQTEEKEPGKPPVEITPDPVVEAPHRAVSFHI